MTIFKRNNETISGRLDNEMVMMDIQKGKYFALNPVATRIWDLLEQPLTMDQLCNQLMEQYAVDQPTCQREVANLLDEMERLGLIRKSGLQNF